MPFKSYPVRLDSRSYSVNNELRVDLTRLGRVLVEGKSEHCRNMRIRLLRKVPTDIRPLAPLVHSATLTQYNEFGQRVDRLNTSEGWRQLERFAIQEGYSAIPYERKYGEHSRTYQFARNMVMTGDCNAVRTDLHARCSTSQHAEGTTFADYVSYGDDRWRGEA